MIRAFADADALAAALAAHVAGAIAERLRRDGNAAIALSGGTTPVKFFQALSRQKLDWAKVTITLVDDRWVPVGSSRSNAAVVARELLQGPAAAAALLPLVNDAATPQAGRAAVEAAIGALPLPFAAVTLGMGLDGHTASFFPGGDRLAAALDAGSGRLVEAMQAPGAIEPRITLTLPVLQAADRIAIHIEGIAKRDVLRAAGEAGPVTEMPIRAILGARPPPAVFWCP